MTSDSHSIHVMLVEDNPADVYLVREALKNCSLDCELTVFEDVDEALEALNGSGSRYWSAVLLDLNLRTGSGLEVLVALRASDSLKQAPVAILTSSDSPRDREAALGSGANLYVRKPTDLDEFLRDIGSAVLQLISKTETNPAQRC